MTRNIERRTALAAMVGVLVAPRALARSRPTVAAASYTSWTPCGLWRSQDYPEWAASERFPKEGTKGHFYEVFHGVNVDFVMFEFESRLDVIELSKWPEQYHFLLNAFLRELEVDKRGWERRSQVDAGSSNPLGSPHFYLGIDGRHVADAVSKNGWKYTILPKLAELRRA